MIERHQWLDIAKGLTIILMVMGHSKLPDIASRFIWAFHIPLYFITSGLTTDWKKHKIQEFCTKKFVTLIIPFFCYSVIVLMPTLHIFEKSGSDWLVNGWRGYALWFVPVLFIALIIDRIVWTLNNKYMRWSFMFLLLVIGTWLSYNKILLPWSLSTVPYASFLVFIGAELKRFSTYIEEPKLWILIISFSITLVIAHYFRLDMAWNNITPVIPLTLGAISGTIMMFSLSGYIAKHTKIISNILQSVGKETYIVVAFSQITIMLLNHYFILNVVIKYLLLIIILITLKYTKDAINKTAEIKLL